MKDLFEMGKKALKDKGKKALLTKIVLPALAAAAPYLLAIIGGLLVILMVLSPFLKFLEKLDNYKENVTGFFDKVGNFLYGRGFKDITLADVEAKEEEFNQAFKEIYDEYLSHGARINAPLISATVYYSLSISYDEDMVKDLNDIGETEPEDTSEEEYDIWKSKIKKLPKLVASGVTVTTTEYKCNEIEEIVDAVVETRYVQGDQVGESKTEPFNGRFKDGESCEVNANGRNIKKYTYQNDNDAYDKYLKEEYIPNSPEFRFPENLTDAEKEFRLDQTVIAIHDFARMYSNVFPDSTYIGGVFSAFCPRGVSVVGGEHEGVYTLEDYIAKVVTRENLFYEGDNIEAMKAQAIAARTYLLNRTNNCAKSIENSTSAQTFAKTANSMAIKAAQATEGMVLSYNGKLFSSEYDSFYCTEVTKCDTGFDCSCSYTKVPDKVTHTVSLPTSKVTGLGGHGRGMSQLVANHMQTQGYKYDQILKFFYADGVEITKMVGTENGSEGSVLVVDGVYYIPADANSGTEGSYTGEKGLNIFFWQRLSSFFAAAELNGHEVTVNYGWRSYQQQVQVKKERPGFAATPGQSLHGWGIAADLGFGDQASKDWAHAYAAEFNLNFAACKNYEPGKAVQDDDMCHEDWHIQPSKIIKQ